MVDALLQQHRMSHRHHVVAEVVPVAVPLAVVGEVPVAEVAEFGGPGVVADPLGGGQVAEVHPDQEMASRVVGPGDEVQDFVHLVGERLLAEDVEALVECLAHQGMMAVGRGGDDHGVRGHDAVEGRSELAFNGGGRCVLVPGSPGPCFVKIHDAGQRRVRGFGDDARPFGAPDTRACQEDALFVAPRSTVHRAPSRGERLGRWSEPNFTTAVSFRRSVSSAPGLLPWRHRETAT